MVARGNTTFYIALAHTDAIAHLSETGERVLMSILRLLPNSLRENLLFSISFDHTIHMTTGLKKPRNIPKALGNAKPKRLFADCGAFQYRGQSNPSFDDGIPVSAQSAWERYQVGHLNNGNTSKWKDILLCSPDQIITRDMNQREASLRNRFTLTEAQKFIELTKHDTRVTPVAVIQGKTLATRKKSLERYIEMGYKYVALGGIVPYSTNVGGVLKMVAGIRDINKPTIGKGSILDRCRQAGVKLHILGLNSPEWFRWWIRLGIDSFDGSKLSTEGAANGWYWIAMDGKGGRKTPKKPNSAADLYRRFAVKKIGLDEKTWGRGPISRPFLIGKFPVDGISTRCWCKACQTLYSWRCASKICQIAGGRTHMSDPRVMGSREHNMGRVVHNAHVLDWMVRKMKRLNKKANAAGKLEPADWRCNWTSIY